MGQHLVDEVLKLSDVEQVEVVVGIIETLQVHSLANLVRKVEDRFGVKASTPITQVQVQPNQPQQVEEKTEFTVLLKAIDAAKKVQAIKEVRAITGLGLKEAKDLVEAAPKVVKEKMAKADAESAKKLLEAAGATVELQ